MDDENIRHYDFPTKEKYYYGIDRSSGRGKEVRAVNCTSDENGSTFDVNGTSLIFLF